MCRTDDVNEEFLSLLLADDSADTLRISPTVPYSSEIALFLHQSHQSLEV